MPRFCGLKLLSASLWVGAAGKEGSAWKWSWCRSWWQRPPSSSAWTCLHSPLDHRAMLPPQVGWCWRTRSQLPCNSMGWKLAAAAAVGEVNSQEECMIYPVQGLWPQKFWWGLGARLLCLSFSPPFFLCLVWKSTNTLTVPLCGLCQYMDVHRWRRVFNLFI